MEARNSAFLADAVLFAHAIVALFAVFGSLLALIDIRVVIIHLPIVVWSSIVNLAHWTCPLTPLEQKLRKHAGEGSFEDGWIQHYLDPLVRPLGMPRRMELIAGISIAAWNLLVYGVMYAIKYSA